jgi:hypothetical protein
MSLFAGATYLPDEDDGRLAGQLIRIYSVMKGGEWRTLQEIAELTGDPQASVSAQLRHLRKPKFGSHVVNRRPRGDRASGLYEYQVLPPGSVETDEVRPARKGINGFDKGLIYAAKILISAPDLETAKASIKAELLKIKMKEEK